MNDKNARAAFILFFPKINGFCLENCTCTQVVQKRELNQTAKVEEHRRWDKEWKESSFLRDIQREKYNLKKKHHEKHIKTYPK